MRLQHEYPTIVCVVDYHAITVHRDPAQLRERRRDMAFSLLAAGINPNVASLLAQSTGAGTYRARRDLQHGCPLGEVERQTQSMRNLPHLPPAQGSPAQTVEHVAARGRSAGWGCIDCKRVLHENMVKELVPIQTRARELKSNPGLMDDALDAGTQKCATIARRTIADVKERMGFD